MTSSSTLAPILSLGSSSKQLPNRGTTLCEIAKAHLQIGIAFEGKKEKPRQDFLVAAEYGIAGPHVPPIGRQIVIARRLFQTRLCDIKCLANRPL